MDTGSSWLAASIAAIARWNRRADSPLTRVSVRVEPPSVRERSGPAQPSEVLVEPAQRALPPIARRLGLVCVAHVAVEPVLGVGVAHDLGVGGRRLERAA